MAVSGSAEMTTTRLGTAGRSYTRGATSRSSASDAMDMPGRSTTKATGTSPECASGSATTEHWATAGCARKASSTRPGSMLCAPRMIRSLARPVMCTRPVASRWPRSPETIQPCSNMPTLRVASR